MMTRVCIGYVLGALLITGCESNSPPPLDVTEESVPTGGDTTQRAQPASADTNAADLGSEGGPVELGKITLTAPAGWVRRAASSGFVLAEFSLPAAQGAEGDARLTVSSAGGDIEANIERWRTQFGGKPEKESRRTAQVDGIEVTLVDLSGEFNDQRGPFAPATKRPGSRMFGAIIPVEGETYFIKAVGPEPTIAAHGEDLETFVQSGKRR
ncbi:MAG: hypothetical protein HY000_36020 [Planctomycetes bacterium]|nr:hypothetical protein [Planctomycetota bacterium]